MTIAPARDPSIDNSPEAQFYIPAVGPASRPRRTLKQDDTFVVVDRAAAKLEQQLEKAKTRVMRRRNADAAQRSVERRLAASGKAPANGPRLLPKAV